MRLFWAILLILLLAGAAAAFLTRPARPTEDRFVADMPYTLPSNTAVAPPEPIVPKVPTPVATTTTPPAPEVDFKLDLENAIGAAARTPPDAPHAPKAAPITEGTPVDLPTTDAWPASKMTPAKAVRIGGEGGELVLDGRYRVKGAGTESDPYIVPFELLMSAGDVYDPRKGLTKMPQRVAFLHQKHVTLSGYVAFPISSIDPHQALVMFNQWDGCCIGVPPTTYDSIETNLAKPATGDDKFITFATAAGVLKVDPYVDNGWLLGLYVLDHGTLTAGNNEPDSPKQPPEN